MKYLVDTNILSEITKPAPEHCVICWMQDNGPALYTCSVVVEEMYFGIMLMPDGKRKYDLRVHADALVADLAEKILSFDASAALFCAQLNAKAHRMGRTAETEDVMIAAVAQANNCVVATRNVRDFAYLDVETFNPFDYVPPEERANAL